MERCCETDLVNMERPINIYWSCKGNKISSRYELIEWVNELLCTDLGEVKQMRSGAAYCQLLDMLFPGSVSLKKVKFRTNDVCQYRHNFNLLQTGFENLKIPKMIPVNKLVVGSYQHNFEFLQWFYTLFQKNCNSETLLNYDPIEARNGCPLDLNASDGTNYNQQFPHIDLAKTISYETFSTTTETNSSITVEGNDIKKMPTFETIYPNKAKLEIDTGTYTISSDEHMNECVSPEKEKFNFDTRTYSISSDEHINDALFNKVSPYKATASNKENLEFDTRTYSVSSNEHVNEFANNDELVYESSSDSKTYTIVEGNASELEITEIPDIALRKITYRVPDITNDVPSSIGSDNIFTSTDALKVETTPIARCKAVSPVRLNKSIRDATNIVQLNIQPTLSNSLIPYKHLSRRKAKKLYNWKTFLNVMERSLSEQIEEIKQSTPHNIKIAPAYSITNKERLKETNDLLALGMLESDKFHETIRERNLLFLEFNKMFKHFRSCVVNSAVPEFEKVLRLIFEEDKGPYLAREHEGAKMNQ